MAKNSSNSGAEVRAASVLAFERKLSNSDGLMYAGFWDDRDAAGQWSPVAVREKDVRGTISNRMKAAIANDPAKLDAQIEKPNLQRVDVASLPLECDTLRLHFTLRVLAQVDRPSACNSQPYQDLIADRVRGYVSEQTFAELSRRYAENLANGRFLWRNRVGAEAIEVRIREIQGGQTAKEWRFDAYSFDLYEFKESDRVAEIAERIAATLAGARPFVLFEIDAFARLGSGQEVFPSQELVLEGARREAKSKYLYEVNGIAAMHSQKIGNALRTIDTWFPLAGEVGPIAVEPYGSVTSRGIAYRQPREKTDFYTLFDRWIRGEAPVVEQQHYVVATLIRGGVFGEKAE